MASKAIKIDAELYAEISRIIKKADYKYKYSSMSAFVNNLIYEKLKELKQKSIFKIKI